VKVKYCWLQMELFLVTNLQRCCKLGAEDGEELLPGFSLLLVQLVVGSVCIARILCLLSVRSVIVVLLVYRNRNVYSGDSVRGVSAVKACVIY